MGVNDWTQPGERPPMNVMGRVRPFKYRAGRTDPRRLPSVQQRTAALLEGDLGAFGLNVPLPRTHAGLLANATAARLMWARKPIKLRWYSPTGEAPFTWRIYIRPMLQAHVVRVAGDVVRDKGGQGRVQITVHQDPTAKFPGDRWWMDFVPVAHQPPPPPPEEDINGPPVYDAAWGPQRWFNFGPKEWRVSGKPDVPGYHGVETQPEPEPEPEPEARPDPPLPPVQRKVNSVIDVFAREGRKAGLRKAGTLGRAFVHGAKAYVSARAWTEPELASELARLRAAYKNVAKRYGADSGRARGLDVRMRFLFARLERVREAVAASRTPPQAIADLGEVPQTALPKWVGWVTLGIAVVGLVGGAGGGAR